MRSEKWLVSDRFLLMAAPYCLMFRAIALTLHAGLRGLRPPSAPLRRLRDIFLLAQPALLWEALGGGEYPARDHLVDLHPENAESRFFLGRIHCRRDTQRKRHASICGIDHTIIPQTGGAVVCIAFS